MSYDKYSEINNTLQSSLYKKASSRLERIIKMNNIISDAEKNYLFRSAKKYSEEAREFISEEISHLMNDKGYDHDRAVAAAIEQAREKGYKVPKKP